DVGLRWCGATPLSTETEDLHVKVSQEAISWIERRGRCCKTLATDRGRGQGQERQSRLEAISGHHHAAITRGINDCSHDAGHWLAATLGARLPSRCGAQTA